MGAFRGRDGGWLLCRSVVLLWVVLLPARHVGAWLDNMDPNKFTCLLPIGNHQELSKSMVWQAFLSSAKERWQSELLPASEKLPSEATKQAKPAAKQAEPAAKAIAPKGVVMPTMPAVSGASHHLDQLLKVANREVTEECARTSDLGAPLYSSAKSVLERAASRRLESSNGSLPLLNEGLDCLEECGHKEGACPTGFCGSGVCCKRWVLNEACPVGFHGGCQDRHCCVKRPSEASSYVIHHNFCNATPGSFCLSSVTVGHDETFSAVELCILQRTVSSCPPGFYCKGGTESPRACAKGLQCPAGSATFKSCPPGYFCPISIIKEPCPDGLECLGGAPFPGVCQGGWYCVHGLRYRCPEGYFCPPGATRATRCALLAHCPEGADHQEVAHITQPALVFALFVWAATVKCIPKGGVWGALPALITVCMLCLAWAAKLDLVYETARHLGLEEDPEHLHVQTLFGGSHHTATAVLALLSLVYTLLLYGLFVSLHISSKFVQQSLDLFVCVATCLIFTLYMQDRSALMLVCNIWAAFKVTWVLLTKQGPWSLRVGLLAAGLASLAVAFWSFGVPELATLLAGSLIAAVGKEVLHYCAPCLQLAFQKRKKQVAESALSDTPFRPLISSLPAESVDARSTVGDIVTHACVTAGARASYAEHKMSGTLGADAQHLSGVMDLDVWAPWVAHICGGGSADAAGGQGVSVELQGVCYRVDGKRKLLHDLSLVVPGGASVAVMGASGSGKTTLLSVLSGRCGDGRFSGELRLNGVPKLPWQMAELRPLWGYVPQDDVMHTMLTVTENIEFQAKLRLERHSGSPAELPAAGVAAESPEQVGPRQQEIRERVETVIRGLGLTQVSNRLASDGLSGGQRKRVSIGMEVVAQPRVLLLDEPTTGLDSTTAHRIMDMVMHRSKSEQCTTFSTIHQPRWPTLGLFDMLILLAPGGHLCFAGPVAVLKDYFVEVLHIGFQEDENPADVIIDACTFESARRMAIDGVWKSPPQCLRAVLFPTPEAAQQENEAPWQQEEFGRMLSAIWGDFFTTFVQVAAQHAPSAGSSSGDLAAATPLAPVSLAQPRGRGTVSASGPASSAEQDPDNDSLAAEAKARVEDSHWGQQVWIYISRSLLILSREVWPTVAMNVSLTIIALLALHKAFPGGNLSHCFLSTALMFMLLLLAQSVAAQRLFGGEERYVAWREASVSSLTQVLFTFIGKDIASLVEIALAAVVVTLFNFPLSKTFASVADFFEITFAFIYCAWGLNHFLAIACPSSISTITATIASFLSFLLCGLRPEGYVVANALNGYGALFLLISPTRWAMSSWLFRHVTGVGAPYLNAAFQEGANRLFTARGYNLQTASPPDMTRGTVERWRDKSGWVCHNGQLFLLGFLFRFIAAIALLCGSSAKASGGQLSLGATSITTSRMLRDCLAIFIVFVFVLNLHLLGQMH